MVAVRLISRGTPTPLHPGTPHMINTIAGRPGAEVIRIRPSLLEPTPPTPAVINAGWRFLRPAEWVVGTFAAETSTP